MNNIDKKTENDCNNKSMGHYFTISLKGFAMGVANVIPGVSGGTIAFITGIYEELISSIKHVASKNFIMDVVTFKIQKLFNDKALRFLIALVLGVVVALGTAANIFLYTLKHYPELTYALFAGLVLASIISVSKKIKKWGVSRIIALLLGAVFAFFVVTLVPVDTPQTWWMFLIGGIIFTCAMILPGLSGSFLMLILGQYTVIWGAVKALTKFDVKMKNISALFFVGCGAILGLGMFSHVLNWLFKKFHDLTVAVLTGFMIGSLWKLWPWKNVLSRSVRSVVDGKVEYKVMEESQYLLLENDPSIVIEKTRVLVENNVLPAQMDGQFYSIIALFILGFIGVLIMEMSLKKNDKNKISSIEG